MSESKKIAVAGATGRVGRHLVAFQADVHDLVLLLHLSGELLKIGADDFLHPAVRVARRRDGR